MQTIYTISFSGMLIFIFSTSKETYKKFLSAEPTGVGRFILCKFLILNFTRVNIGLKEKMFHTKNVGIERTSPTILHMTAFRTVLF